MMYKNYIEMREGMGKRLFISTKKCGGTISSFVTATMRLIFLEIGKRGLERTWSVALSKHVNNYSSRSGFPY